MQQRNLVLIYFALIASILSACSTSNRYDSYALKENINNPRSIASTSDPAFRAAMADLENIPNVMVPPNPYDFWAERTNKLLAQSAVASEIATKYGLSQDECVAIMAYSDTIYAVVNRALWNKDENTLKRLAPIIATLNQGLSKLPKFVGLTYRIVGFGASVDRKTVLRENKLGSVSNYLGYTSTSKNANWFSKPENQRSDGLFLKIESKSGRWIGPLTASALNGQSQDEVLFLPNSQFKVTGIDSPISSPATISLIEEE